MRAPAAPCCRRPSAWRRRRRRDRPATARDVDGLVSTRCPSRISVPIVTISTDAISRAPRAGAPAAAAVAIRRGTRPGTSARLATPNPSAAAIIAARRAAAIVADDATGRAGAGAPGRRESARTSRRARACSAALTIPPTRGETPPVEIAMRAGPRPRPPASRRTRRPADRSRRTRTGAGRRARAAAPKARVLRRRDARRTRRATSASRTARRIVSHARRHRPRAGRALSRRPRGRRRRR